MGINGNGGLFDVAQIGLAALIERRGHADDDGVDVLQSSEIRGRAEMLAVDELLDLILGNMLDIGFACIEHVHFGGVSVKSRNFMSRFGKSQRQRQAHIPAADDSDFELIAFEEFGFSVNWHGLRCAPRSL